MTLPRLAAAILAAALCLAPFAAGAALAPATFDGFAFAPKPGAPIPSATLRDEAGREVDAARLIAGRPAIVVLEYLACPNLCGLVLGGLAENLARVPLTSGRDYDVFAISIDPRETPADAAAARRGYEDRFGAAALAGWRFLTGEEAQVRRIADAVGFPYRWDASSGQYAHPAGIVVATPDGRVSRYLFGVEFGPLDLRLALTEASSGEIASVASRLLLLCYGYDPKTGGYEPAVMNALRGGAVLTVALAGGLILRQIRRDARRGA